MAWKDNKWWGWGEIGKKFDLTAHPRFLSYLGRFFSLPARPVIGIPDPSRIEIPSSRLYPEHKEALSKITAWSSEGLERLIHAVGKSYHDLIRLRYGKRLNFPDAVVYPRSEEEIEKILSWASQNTIAVVPFGGGTSVVGGVEAIGSREHKAVVVLSMKDMNQITAFHESSWMVEAQAGIQGPALENFLQSKGFTLGHFPESFEYSTLGGWIATRSAGSLSSLYGKIEAMVENLRIVTPQGILETTRSPASATGPDIQQIFIGSEGTLGVISHACMKIRPIPVVNSAYAYLLQDFVQGIDIASRLSQGPLMPSLLRLSDGQETELALSLNKWPSHPILSSIVSGALRWIEKRGYSAGQRSLLLLSYEGSKDQVKEARRYTRSTLAKYKTISLGGKPVRMWQRHRYENPYLRDELIAYGLLVDTLETATEWDRVMTLYHAVVHTIESILDKMKIRGFVSAHLSHLYPQGSSLYFIIIAQPVLGQELEQWQQIKNAASLAILENGGTISHHHGIGLDHTPWFIRQIPCLAFPMLKSLKQNLDPCGILNPGKLLPFEY